MQINCSNRTLYDKTNYLHHTHPTISKQENIAFPLSMDIITHQIINISTAQCRNVSLNAIHKTKAKQNKNNNAFAFSVHIFIPLIINMFEEQHGYYSLNLPTKNSWIPQKHTKQSKTIKQETQNETTTTIHMHNNNTFAQQQ